MVCVIVANADLYLAKIAKLARQNVAGIVSDSTATVSPSPPLPEEIRQALAPAL